MLGDQSAEGGRTVTVYFAQAGGPEGPVKIGYTKGPARPRVMGLQTGHPEPIVLRRELPGAPLDMEKWLHGVLAPHHIRGEWFRFARCMLTIDFVRAWDTYMEPHRILAQQWDASMDREIERLIWGPSGRPMRVEAGHG